MNEKEQYCPLGKLLMDYFIEYIDNKNQENYTKNFTHYNDAKLFKKIKPTQTELAKTLEMFGNNGRLLKNNLSNYLRGTQPFPKTLILQVTNKLKLNGSQFIELVKEYALQNNLLEKEYHYKDRALFSNLNAPQAEKIAKSNIQNYYIQCITYCMIIDYIDTFCKEPLNPYDNTFLRITKCIYSSGSMEELLKSVTELLKITMV